MALIYQLDLFQAPEATHFRAVEDLIESLKESQDRVRKGCFARINELGKENRDLKERLEILERNICRQSEPLQLESRS